MKTFLLTLAGIGSLSALVERPVRFDSYKAVEFLEPTPALKEVLEARNADIWEFDGEKISAFIDSKTLQEIKELGFKQFKELEVNIQGLVDQETFRINSAESEVKSFETSDWFKEYHRYEEIVLWYRGLAKKYPELVRISPVTGLSHEGRELFSVSIGPKSNSVVKKQVYIQSLQHAREWIGGATTQFIVNKLLESFESSYEVQSLLNEIELIVVPVMNPDGYEYTWTTNRMWRKNRRAGQQGMGVDLNRNWNDHWGEGGSSSDPRSDTYKGPSAASEPEVKFAESVLLSCSNLIAAIDYHSFSQLVLRPSGWTRIDPKHNEQHKKAADVISNTIRSVSGLSYKNQKSVELYLTTGSLSDFTYGQIMYEAIGRPIYSLTIELRPSSMFAGGFVLDPKYIIPTGEENYAAFINFLRFILENPLE